MIKLQIIHIKRMKKFQSVITDRNFAKSSQIIFT